MFRFKVVFLFFSSLLLAANLNSNNQNFKIIENNLGGSKLLFTLNDFDVPKSEGKHEFQANERLMTDITKETRIKEITDLETRIREYEAKAQEDLQKKQVELISPVFEKAQSAIDAVAKESGFTYVFDTSKGVVLFANDSEDILTLVKKKLGI